MYRKLFLLSLLCILGVFGLVGCNEKELSTEYSEIDYSTIDFETEQSSFAERDKELYVLTEEKYRSELEQIALWYMRSQSKLKVNICVLSEDVMTRETEIQRIRTEIMAGKGPDLFVLGTQNEMTVESDRRAPLFTNINSTIRTGFFEAISEYMKKDLFWDSEPIGDNFLQVGRWNQEQYVLPLSCDYYVLAGTQETGENLGNNFSQLIIALLNTDNEVLKRDAALIWRMVCRIYQPAINYEDKGVNYKENEWNSLISNELLQYQLDCTKIKNLDERAYYVTNTDMLISEVKEMYVESQNNKALKFIYTIPGLDEQCVASVSAWGAVGRNCEYKQEAYDFLMLLLNNKVAEENMVKEGDLSFYPSVDEVIGVDSIPVYKDSFEQYLTRKEIAKNEKKMFLKSFEEIDKVYFPTQVESLTLDALEEVFWEDIWSMSFSEIQEKIAVIADQADDRYRMIAKE